MKRKKKQINKYSIYKTLPPDMRPLKKKPEDYISFSSIEWILIGMVVAIISGLGYIAFSGSGVYPVPGSPTPVSVDK